MQTQNNIPALRFSEFDGEWINKKLGKIYKINAGGDIDNEKVSFIKTEKFKYPIYANAKKEKGFYGYSDTYKIEEGTITVAGRGVHIGIAHARDHKYYPIVRLLILKPLANEDIYFSENAINRLNLFIESTGVPQLTAPQFSNYKISIPSLPEQQKIASFLSAVDEKIQQLTRKAALLEQYKKGIMKQLFSGTLRFKDDDGKDFPEWEEKKLGEVVIEYNNKSQINDQYVVLSSSMGGIKLQSDYFNKDVSSKNNAGYKIVPKGYFTYRSMSDTGSFTFNIQNIVENGIVSPAYPVFKPKKNINSLFLSYYLNNSNKIINNLLSLKEGGTRFALSFNKFSKLEVVLPSLKEQQKIASFLSGIDGKIASVNGQLAQTQTFKKGLLQQMFV